MMSYSPKRRGFNFIVENELIESNNSSLQGYMARMHAGIYHVFNEYLSIN